MYASQIHRQDELWYLTLMRAPRAAIEAILAAE